MYSANLGAYAEGRLRFEQKLYYRNQSSRICALQANDEETHTRHQMIIREKQEDGFLVVHVRNQFNNKADVSEYFQ